MSNNKVTKFVPKPVVKPDPYSEEAFFGKRIYKDEPHPITRTIEDLRAAEAQLDEAAYDPESQFRLVDLVDGKLRPRGKPIRGELVNEPGKTPFIRKLADMLDPVVDSGRANPALNHYCAFDEIEVMELMKKPVRIQISGPNPSRTFDKLSAGFAKHYQHEWEETFVDIAMKPSMFDKTLVIDSMREYPTGKDLAALKMAEGGFKPGEKQVIASFSPRPYQKSMIMALAAKGYYAAGNTMKHYDPEAYKGSPPTLSLVGTLIKRLFRPVKVKPSDISTDEFATASVELMACYAMMHGLRERGLFKSITESHDVGTTPPGWEVLSTKYFDGS